MDTTRLGLNGGPRTSYGSFVGKGKALGRITRLGLYGGARSLYGNFAGKVPASISVSRLGLHGGPRPPYGNFGGKVRAPLTLLLGDSVAVTEDTIRLLTLGEGDTLGGTIWLSSEAALHRLRREDEELADIIAAIVMSGMLE